MLLLPFVALNSVVIMNDEFLSSYILIQIQSFFFKFDLHSKLRECVLQFQLDLKNHQKAANPLLKSTLYLI